MGSFVFVLFPMMVFQRWLGRLFEGSEKAEFTAGLKLPSLLNYVFYAATLIDVAFVRVGVRLPWGGSLVAVAHKPSR